MGKIKSSVNSTIEAYDSIKRGMTGDYTPLKTRFEHLNNITHGGLTKQKIYTFGALSGFGKSHTLRQIESDIFDKELNPNSKSNVILIKCDWEQTKEEYVLTKVHEKTGTPFSELLYNEPSDKDQKAFNEVYLELTDDNIYEAFDTFDPDNFYEEVSKFCKDFKDKDQIVLTIDNANLIDDENHRGEREALAVLTKHLIRLKREIKNLTIILLAQLNRGLKDRSNNPTEQFPRTTDFFASSKIEHASDVMVVFHNPYMLGITEYGAVNFEKYRYLEEFLTLKSSYAQFKTKGLVFWHYVKVRLKNNLKDFKDLFIEKVYEEKESDIKENNFVSQPDFSDSKPNFKNVKDVFGTTNEKSF